MAREDKMDVLNMVIDILVAHEKKLDELIGRFESNLDEEQLLEDWR